MDARALIAVALVGCGDSTAVPIDAVPVAVDAVLVPPAGNVGWFDGRCCGDLSGHGYQVVFGGPFSDAFGPGYRGQGFKMDGFQQRALVDTSHVPEQYLDFAGPFTIAAWVRIDRVPAEFEVIVSRSYGSADDSSYTLAIDSNLKLRYDSQDGNSLTGTTSVPIGTWTHAALTFDGTTKRVFINGALEGIQTTSVPVTYDHAWIDIGGDEGVDIVHGTHYLLGTIDEVMFFDRALDASELAGL